jgi:hypothetical protein
LIAAAAPHYLLDQSASSWGRRATASSGGGISIPKTTSSPRGIFINHSGLIDFFSYLSDIGL